MYVVPELGSMRRCQNFFDGDVAEPRVERRRLFLQKGVERDEVPRSEMVDMVLSAENAFISLNCRIADILAPR